MHVPSGVLLRFAGSSETFFVRPSVETVITTRTPAGGGPCSVAHCFTPLPWSWIASLYGSPFGFFSGGFFSGGFFSGGAFGSDPVSATTAEPAPSFVGPSFFGGRVSSGDDVMLTTAGGCWFCICFQTRNSAPPAMPTIASASNGHTMLRFGACACGIDPMGKRLWPLVLDSLLNGGGVCWPVKSFASRAGPPSERISTGASVIVESTAGNSSSSSSPWTPGWVASSCAISGIVERAPAFVLCTTRTTWSVRLRSSPSNSRRMKSPISPCDHGRSPWIESSTAVPNCRADSHRFAGSRSSARASVTASASGTSGR